MFTGLIEITAEVLEWRDGHTLIVSRPGIFTDIALGDSISVNGVCLTIKKSNQNSLQFDVISLTKEKTNLSKKQAGDLVNLERAMRADGRFGGHIVTGHVEGVCTVQDVRTSMIGKEIDLSVPLEYCARIVPEGSVTLDGVSLTVAGIEGTTLTIGVIPETLARTTFGPIQKGQTVNIETDILAKYLQKLHAYQ